MSEYMLVLHYTPSAAPQLSPSDMQKMVEAYVGWTNSLIAKGIFKGGQQLKEGGKSLRQSGSGITLDAPMTEVKEVIGGFYIFTAASEQEALEIAKTCPHLAYGGRVEVRELYPVQVEA